MTNKIDYTKALTSFKNFRNLQNALVQEMDVDAAISALELARKVQSGEYDGEGTYAGWKAKSRAHAIVRMLEFHGDKPSERIVEIAEIIAAQTGERE